MRFLADRCAGRRLATWLRDQGHDVVEARELGPDPGDRALLARAAEEGRILITMDTDSVNWSTSTTWRMRGSCGSPMSLPRSALR